MADPTTAAGASLTVLVVAALGPLYGPYALIAGASLAGALWPLSAQPTATRLDGALLLLRCALTALLLTAFIAGLLQRVWAVPVNEALAPIALVIGAMGNGWRPVFGALGAAAAAVIGRAGEGKS